MALTLYLYDSDGTEMAWVTADPYEYSVADFVKDNPDIPMEKKLESLEVVRLYDSEQLNPNRGAGHVDKVSVADFTPREQLENIDGAVSPYCDSIEIVDE